ncbi:MAG TPA: glycosyltransferase family 39 protein [Usitatibacter sp.]|nr:glycosyltransferase family 39 protein [Usitatibacter sp.]
MDHAPARAKAVSPARLAVLLAIVFAILAGSAMLHTSTTFDEIVFMCVGARGIDTGDFSLVIDHPRLPQYIYGLPVYLMHVKYPPEGVLTHDWMPRYYYARTLLWGLGNPAEHIVMATRAVALAFGAATVAATFALARRHMSAWSALFAAALVAFLPDMLAHSGVAYNDIPLAFGFLVTLYAFDAAVRRPSPRIVAAAGVACALTVCVKYSGLILGPILVALVAAEALSGRWRDRAWRHSIFVAIPVFLGAMYVTIALVYLGDWTLRGFTGGLMASLDATVGRTANLLGERYRGGRWYFFPVAFLLKTPAALHVLVLVALVAAWGSLRDRPWREWLTHGARAPVVGIAFFLAGLVTSSMNIGFRHALPMLPLICIMVAQGVGSIWGRARPALRTALGIVFAAYVASTSMHYPYFLAYLSEYTAGRPLYRTLVDSSTDWGEGLVALRAFMQERGVDSVALGYFGSTPPEAYGIRYYPLPSYYQLPAPEPNTPEPRYLVVSATLLAGNYVADDPYAPLRALEPVAVIADTLYVFDMQARR